MQTLVELPEYIRRASSLLKDSEKQGIINYLAGHPLEGATMQGTGGIRKFRWTSGNKGKSGGVRVIYYFHSKALPLFLLTVFGKNEKANLSKSERNELARFVNLLTKNYGETSV
ncbi:MAG: addiction module toxin RelE [Methylococcaceae bacterium]|nr:addiction module toxin RelE [Methylococcaceae bacterium]